MNSQTEELVRQVASQAIELTIKDRLNKTDAKKFVWGEVVDACNYKQMNERDKQYVRSFVSAEWQMARSRQKRLNKEQQKRINITSQCDEKENKKSSIILTHEIEAWAQTGFIPANKYLEPFYQKKGFAPGTSTSTVSLLKSSGKYEFSQCEYGFTVKPLIHEQVTPQKIDDIRRILEDQELVEFLMTLKKFVGNTK